MTLIPASKLNQKLEQILFVKEIAPYITQDVLYNGWQVRANERVARLGFGVSASLALFTKAKQAKCDGLVVHHGLLGGTPWLDTLSQQRFGWLINNNLSLWSYHFTLDAHPILGHNTQILKYLGITKTAPYFVNGMPWGRIGQFARTVELNEVQVKLQKISSPRAVWHTFGNKKIQKIACVSGSGAPKIEVLTRLQPQKVDLYISGESREWLRDACREAGVNFGALGHYNSEKFGLLALKAEVQKKLRVLTVWLDVPNSE